MHVFQLHKTGIRILRSYLLFNKTLEVISSVTFFRHGNISRRYVNDVVLSAHGKKFSKFSESPFDSLPSSGISWWLKMFRCNYYKMVVPNCWWIACNPAMVTEPNSGGNVSSSEI